MNPTYVSCPNCEKLNRVPLDRAETASPVCGNCKTRLPLEHGVVTVNGTGLQQIVSHAPLPVIADFWAPQCVPCRTFEPIYSQAATRFGGRLIFTKLNSLEHMLAADTYRIRSIPTLIFFHRGSETDRKSGALPGEHFNCWLESALSRISIDEAGQRSA